MTAARDDALKQLQGNGKKNKRKENSQAKIEVSFWQSDIEVELNFLSFERCFLRALNLSFFWHMHVE